MELSDEQADYLAERLYHMFSPGALRPPYSSWDVLSPRAQDIMRAKAKVLLEDLPE